MDPPELSGDLGEVDAAGLAPGAEVQDALVTGELLGASVADLTISGCRFDRVRLTGSSLDGVALEDVLFADCELSGVTMGGAKLERVRFENCRMSGLSAADLHAEHVGFEDCRLDDAWFRMSDIERAEFLDCDLRKADFYATTVRRTAFIGCDLTGAELSKAVVAEVRLERSTIIDVGGIGDLRDIVLSPGAGHLVRDPVPGLVRDHRRLRRLGRSPFWWQRRVLHDTGLPPEPRWSTATR